MRSFQFLSAVLLAGLVFTSCQKDDQVLPEEERQNTALKQRDLPVEQTIQFTSWQDILVAPPECPITTKSYVEDHDDAKPSKIAGCLGEFGFDGSGAGFLEGFDRYYIETSVKYDAASRMFYGMVNIDFASHNSALRLRIEGPGHTYTQGEDGTVIEIPVTYYAGSGIFEQVEFHGVLKIMHADEIFDAQTTEYHATLLIDGEFTPY